MDDTTNHASTKPSLPFCRERPVVNDNGSPASDLLNEPVWLSEINEMFAVVNDGGKLVVMYENRRKCGGRVTHECYSLDEFANHLCEERVSTDARGEAVYQPGGIVWLAHPRRRQYINGVALLPYREVRDSIYNLWRGYGVEAKQGDWSMMKRYLRDVICSGNPRHFEYLMRWMAYAVQHPNRCGEVAVVLKGGNADLKRILTKYLHHCFGQHYFQVDCSAWLTGPFSVSLRDAVLVYVEEDFFADDPNGNDVLKPLIYAPLIRIKGPDPIQVPNYTHVIMAVKSDWVVPAGLERRFFVLNVSDRHHPDELWFDDMRRHMQEEGGMEAMLWDLQHIDLSNFAPRKPAFIEMLAPGRLVL